MISDNESPIMRATDLMRLVFTSDITNDNFFPSCGLRGVYTFAKASNIYTSHTLVCAALIHMCQKEKIAILAAKRGRRWLV